MESPLIIAHARLMTPTALPSRCSPAILAYHLRISMALMEICVGIAAGALAEHYLGPDAFGADREWLRFLASLGAVILTFLAGAELDPM